MKKGYLYILLATLFFSSMETALKFISGQFNPFQLTFIRFLIGSLIILPLALRSLKNRHLNLNFEDVKLFALIGFICVVVSMSLYQMAILNAPASIVAVLFSSTPVFVIPLAHFVVNEKIYKSTWLSMMVSLLGMIWIMNPFKMSANVAGIIFTLLSAATFAIYSVVSKANNEKYGAVILSCFGFLMGSLELLIFILVSHIDGIATYFIQNGLKTFAYIPLSQGLVGSNLPVLFYVSVGVTGLGYMFYFLALQETSTSAGSVVFYVKPALAPIFALVLLKESITLNVWIGIVFVLAGSVITLVANYRRLKAEPAQKNQKLALSVEDQ
jgi:drug/metabolite transporter (DMT)-like permease